MIIPKKHPVITPFFMWYIRQKLYKHFRDIKFIGSGVPDNVPLLAIGNHISWWDGFFILFLTKNHIKRELYVMMLEEQLAANPILKYGGAFSIKRGTKNVLESLHFACEKLYNPNSMVLVFPQGKLNSVYSDNFVFESGIEYILNAKYNIIPPELLFTACLIEYGPYSKPTLFIHYKLYKNEKYTIAEITNEYTGFYQQCLRYNIENITNL
jgi:1-acyl-sn-glycerol-3-phosphate acyltransferase